MTLLNIHPRKITRLWQYRFQTTLIPRYGGCQYLKQTDNSVYITHLPKDFDVVVGEFAFEDDEEPLEAKTHRSGLLFACRVVKCHSKEADRDGNEKGRLTQELRESRHEDLSEFKEVHKLRHQTRWAA